MQLILEHGDNTCTNGHCAKTFFAPLTARVNCLGVCLQSLSIHVGDKQTQYYEWRRKMLYLPSDWSSQKYQKTPKSCMSYRKWKCINLIVSLMTNPAQSSCLLNKEIRVPNFQVKPLKQHDDTSCLHISTLLPVFHEASDRESSLCNRSSAHHPLQYEWAPVPNFQALLDKSEPALRPQS